MKTNTSSLLLTLLLTYGSLSLTAEGVIPAPDGDYPGGNTAEGFKALFSLSTQDGGFNTAVGFFSLFANTTGSFNTAVGAGALDLNTGHNNTATGAASLLLNTTGGANTGLGAFALLLNTTGDGNTAVGATALQFNTEGAGNTAVGAEALLNNDGLLNTAVGLDALSQNTIGAGNTAVGAGRMPSGLAGIAALGSNTTGDGNTAVGGTTGVGHAALGSNTTGDGNTAIGKRALNSNTTGSNNTAVGADAGNNLTTGDNNIDIGNSGVADEANTIRIGGTQTATYIAGISGTTVTGTAVVVNASGQLGVAPSSGRFKDEIKPMDKASEAILALKPVTFRYKQHLDPNHLPQFGLIAEEVEKVNPDLVVRDKEGKPYSVRYDQVNAMLLNEFLKEHHQLQDLKAIVTEQQKQIEALTAGLQKVSAQLEVSKSAPQTVLNNQ